MKQIIDNVLYDTEKAELIYSYTGFLGRTFKFFKSKTGRYFRVTKDFDDEDMKVLDESFVKALLGQENIDKYIELFGAPEEA